VLQGPAHGRRRVLVVRQRTPAPAVRVPLSVQSVRVVRERVHRHAVGPRVFRSDRHQPGRLLPRDQPGAERHVQGVPVQTRLLQRRRRRWTGRVAATAAGVVRGRGSGRPALIGRISQWIDDDYRLFTPRVRKRFQQSYYCNFCSVYLYDDESLL